MDDIGSYEYLKKQYTELTHMWGNRKYYEKGTMGKCPVAIAFCAFIGLCNSFIAEERGNKHELKQAELMFDHVLTEGGMRLVLVNT